MATSAQQVQELSNQMQSLALEKQRLEAQNRVLLHTVKLSTRHIQDTAAEKVKDYVLRAISKANSAL